MKLKRILVACLAAMMVSAAIGFVACGETTEEPSGGETEYTLTYARGADDATGTVPAAERYAAGDAVTLKSASVFARANYTFDGWDDGADTYAGGAKYTMPAHDVTLTAQWKADASVPPQGGGEVEDVPETAELPAAFYAADNWEYMTNNGGTSSDIGEIVYALDDGSVKFHRANQAIEIGDLSESGASFLLKGTNDWSVWFNAAGKDNASNAGYRLSCSGGGLRLEVFEGASQALAMVTDSTYAKGQWNRIDVAFDTQDGVCSVRLYVNGERAALSAGTASLTGVTVQDDTLIHTRSQTFVAGGWMAVKVWEAHNFLQIKPIAAEQEEDVPVIACIGASITEGAGADDFYTESYPAQLQQALGGEYNVINFGNSGKTVRTDLGDDVAWLRQYQWTGVQSVVPDIVILNIGTNDSKTSNVPATTTENFTEAYTYLLDQLLAVNPDMQLYICTVPYAYTDIWDISNENIRDIIAPVQRALAEEYGATLIDLYKYSQNKSLLFGDGVHPNTTGYAMFVEIIQKALEEGEAGLTDEFIADIDARYNDKVSGYTATLAGSADALTLTVSGTTSLTEGVRVYVGSGEGNEHYFDAAISDGTFRAEIDLTQLPLGGDWYNVRVYVGEGYHILLLDETSYASGDSAASDEVKAQVVSWSSNWGATFSLKLTQNLNVKLTQSAIEEADGELTLSLAGTTNDTALRLYVGENPEGDVYREYIDVTVGAGGAFSTSFDLAAMPVGGWYNVRLYYTDGSYFVIPLAQTTSGGEAVAKGDVFYTDTTSVTVQSWSDGGVGTLSFDVKEYDGTLVPEVNVTSASLVESEGKIVLTVSGTTNDDGIRLYVGNNKDDGSFYHAVTVNEGAFTIQTELSALAPGSSWYEVLIYYNEEYYTAGNTDYFTLRYTQVTGTDGETLAKGDLFYTDSLSIKIESWADWSPLSLVISEYTPPEPSAPTVSVSAVAFEDGNFVVTGNAQNIAGDLRIYLINTNVSGTADNYVTAQIGQDGAFTVRLPLSTLAGYNVGSNIPFNLRYSVDDGATKVNIPQGSLDLSQQYAYGDVLYTMKTNGGCVAVYYAALTYEYRITEASIEEVDGVATLIIEGTTTDASVAASALTLILDKTSATADKRTYENEATEAGTFRFAIDISDLAASDRTDVDASAPYFIRLYNGSAKLADVNSVWASDALFEEVTIGDSVYAFYRNNMSAYYTLGVVRMPVAA